MTKALRIGTTVFDRAGLMGTIVNVTEDKGSRWYDVRLPGGVAVRFESELLTPERALTLIYRHTHRDYKGKIGGCGAILVLRKGGTALVMMTALTDKEIAEKLPYALRKEAERKTSMEAA